MSSALKAWTMVALLSVGGCSDGRWGSELRVDLVALAAQNTPIGASAIELPGGQHRLELTRLCLSVEAISVVPLAADAAAEVTSGHSHGGEGGTSAATAPVVQEVHAVVDLTSAGATLMRRGVWPGGYEHATLTLAQPRPDAHLAVGCADMAGRLLLLEGTLVETVSGTRTPVTLNLRAGESKMTEEIELDAEAPIDGVAELRLGLRLDAWLAPLVPVLTGGAAPLVVDGEVNQHPDVAGRLLDGLSSPENYEVALQ